MKKTILFSLSVIVFLILVVSCAGSSTPTPATVDPEALINEKCSKCHPIDRVFQANYTEEEWSEVFDEMIEKGADVDPIKEKNMMIDWLLTRDQ